MVPNFRPDSKQNLHSAVKIFILTAFSALVPGCFRQSAPDRIPSAETLDACLAASGDLQFAHLSAENGRLEAFPEALASCPALWKLGLRGQTALAPLPAAIGSLRGLRWLDLSEIGLDDLPAELGSLPLRRLYLSDNKFESLPAAVAALHDLDYLNLDRNRLTSLPPEVGGWSELRWLRLNGNRLQSLPVEAANWKALRRLYLRENDFESVPDVIASLPALEQLDLGRNPRLATVPTSIGSLASLTRLDLDYTAVTTLPDAIGNLRALKTLVLVGCPLASGELKRIRSLLPADCTVEY